MSSKPLTDAELDQHLRRTLRAVAASVEDASDRLASPRRRRKRRMLLGLGGVAVAVSLTAGAVLEFGPEYVDRIPPDNVIVSGSLDGERYWMVQSFHRDECDRLNPGVEIVVEEHNIIGREWSTTGYNYGEPRPPTADGSEPGCGYDTSAALKDPARSFSSGTQVGDARLWVYAVHPDVTALEVTVDGDAREVPVHPHHGAGYAVVELPEGTRTYTVVLLRDGEAVPGSRQTRELP